MFPPGCLALYNAILEETKLWSKASEDVLQPPHLATHCLSSSLSPVPVSPSPPQLSSFSCTSPSPLPLPHLPLQSPRLAGDASTGPTRTPPRTTTIATAPLFAAVMRNP
ncbi:hypothetical protein E2C01_027602 [Portunus trituberculatus]|uniref:Uncharacterized protein n=1 Tax=Portunus trituberculatus TaxID=210409 RepID=A0A5B7EM27_PORTR|nr:hypothetical protein [Portunus trituberculatus]